MKKNTILSLLFCNIISFCAAQSTDSAAYTFFIPAAIKTIAGNTPDTELFDLTFNLNAGQSQRVSRTNFFGSIDVALSNTGTDSISSSTDKLFDASISVNLDLGKKDDLVYKDLRIYLGPEFRVYNTHAYYGLHFGGMLVGKHFYSSFFNIGFIKPLNPTELSEGLLTRFSNNLIAEFAFTSNDAPVLKNIRVKGGILFPLGNDATDNDITTRIVVQVPIGGIYKFGKVKKPSI